MDNQEMNLFEHNKQVLSGVVAFHSEDMLEFDNSINDLIDAGVGKLKEATEEESDSYNWELLLTNEEDHVYYLEITAYGSIAILKDGGPEGKIIQAVKCGVMMPDQE